MGTLKWYKRDPRAALTGMMSLTLEERGAYNTILDLIYCHDGQLLDDPVEILPWLGVDIRIWERIRLKLLDKGKLYVHAGYLHNERADQEVVEAIRRVVSATEAINKRWAIYNEIKRLNDTGVILPTTTYKKVSATIVPISKKDDRDKK